ncbi:MAG: TraX family protein [Eubacteriales bacterium]|nr:TraX family protein [Eubacteriales bacterium]
MEQTDSLERRRGLDGFQLKLLALVIMTIDHIHYFGSTLTDVPLILTLIGRIAAPIFVFFVAEGFAHTRNRGKYLLRLYIGATLMQLGNLLVNHFFPLPGGAITMNGIFSTMTCIVICLWWIENCRKAKREGKYGRAVLYVLALIVFFLSFLPVYAVSSLSLTAVRVLLVVLPSPVLCEGGFVFVLLGVGFYYCRNSKKAIAVFYTAWIAVIVLLSGITAYNIQFAFFTWLALPFILLYNGQRGRGMKYLFYIYYPAHVYLFAIAASLLGR